MGFTCRRVAVSYQDEAERKMDADEIGLTQIRK